MPASYTCLQCGSVGMVSPKTHRCRKCKRVMNAGKSKPPVHRACWAPSESPPLPDLQCRVGIETTDKAHWDGLYAAGEISDTYDNLVAVLDQDAMDEQALADIANNLPRHHYPHVGPKGQLVIGRYHKKFNPDDLACALSALGEDVGYDSQANKTAYRRSDEEWKVVNDRNWKGLTFRIEKRCFWEEPDSKGRWSYQKVVVSPRQIFDCIDAHCEFHQFDRFRSYLDECARKHPDIGPDYCRTLLEKLYYVGSSELAAEASEYILSTPVRRSCPKGAKADIMPILQGAQGIGKSSMIYHLLPREVDGICDGANFAGSTQEFAHQIDGKLLVEVPDLHGFRGAKLEKIKAAITRRDDHERRKYARYAETTHRRCVFIGTENSSNSIPDDPTGTRRWVIIELQERLSQEEVVKFLVENRDKYWASVQLRIKQVGVNHIPFEGYLAEIQAEVNEKHRDSDDVIEGFVENDLDGSEPLYGHEVIKKCVDYLENNNLLADERIKHRVRKALEKLGWRKLRPMIDGVKKLQWHSPVCKCQHCESERLPKKDGSYASHREVEAAKEADAGSNGHPADSEFREQFEQAHQNGQAGPVEPDNPDRRFKYLSLEILGAILKKLTDSGECRHPSENRLLTEDEKKLMWAEVEHQKLTWLADARELMVF